MPDLNLDRVADLVSRHPWAAVLVALALGLIAPPGLRRFAQWTVVFVFWVAVLPAAAGAGGFALYVVGIRVVPSDDDLPPLSAQLVLPFDR